ncbi:MAG: hypothetical protein M3P50_04195 [Actinomycetota bacterium]|nr:hypothetical protein [Actinomycetota bacterium]
MGRGKDASRGRQAGGLTACGLVVAALAMTSIPATAGAATETLTFPPEADTYVSADKPSTSAGTSTSLYVDASPQRQAFLRFWALGLAGREVTGVRLRMTQRDASPSGGRVFGVSSLGWSEAITWSTRPLLDGGLLGSYGAVADGGTYAAELGAGEAREGVQSYGMDSPSSDGARWGSGESSTPPRLEVDVETPAGFVADGLSLVAGHKAGSSEPTYVGSNRRLATTAAGRILAVHGRHYEGVQLAWREPAGGWRTRTTGAMTDGLLLGGTGTGDWPASIAVTRDAAGREVAWVVWSGVRSSGARAVRMRRLTDLDAPEGPRVGPVVTVDAPELGAYRADVAFERRPDGSVRGCVLWSRRVSDTYEIATAWFDPFASEPTVGAPTVLYRSTSSARFGTLASTPQGLRAVTRAGSGRLVLYAHAAGDSPSWSRGATGPYISSGSAPSAVGLGSGEVLVAVERDVSDHVTGLYRFSGSGGSVSQELELSGAAQPTVAAGPDGRAVVGAVRSASGDLVSRERSASGTWSSSDRVEVSATQARGRPKFPNALREADGRLRVLVEGPDGSTYRSSVLAYQRPF